MRHTRRISGSRAVGPERPVTRTVCPATRILFCGPKWTGGDNHGEWEKSPYNPDFEFYNESRITTQAEKLPALNEDLGGKGVRNMVSNEWGAAHVNEVPSMAFPEAYASGQLRAYHARGNGMSGMSSWPQ
ncbi:hypothetical protein [Streptomyces sp. ISL-10]|uniref:hypothetical protein n=1 Tax=Streptomyces sp. ISL-10 TaxID=2819172 RepID=UPI002035908A|nr:hypothetical protein [Streptomyces sp. ISL-10]